MSSASLVLNLSREQQQQTEHTSAVIRAAIAENDGRIGFDQFMALALYAPGAGYYANGSVKFGAAGDFVTAPEISPLFAQCVANQCAPVLAELDDPCVLEFGAGSGKMAADVLLQLEQLGCLPAAYQILELSPMLQAEQRATLERRVPHLLERVVWLQALPEPGWQGVVLGNEVLDAMPVKRFRWHQGACQEAVVVINDDQFAFDWQAASAPLAQAVATIIEQQGEFAEGYTSEVNLSAAPWLASIADFLERGLVLLIDYGYSAAEFYHPQRDAGTLIAHFRHQAHDQVLAMPGLQDITANVDFSALAHAGLDAGLTLAGYTTQAFFLLGNGLDGLLQSLDDDAMLSATTEIKQLTLPTAMGERFKVIGFQRGLSEQPLAGFAMRDLRAYL